MYGFGMYTLKGLTHLCVQGKVGHGDDELEPDGEVVFLDLDPPLLDLLVN